MNNGRLKQNFLALTLLLALLVLLNLIKQLLKSSDPGYLSLNRYIFIEISGDVKFPGVYDLGSSQNLEELIARSGGTVFDKKGLSSISKYKLKSGEKVVISAKGSNILISRSEMSPFFKTTLGIPLSLNQETAVGLTAIPGIGLKTALAIVEERTEKGGFKKTDEIMSVPGVGPKLYKKIMPFLKL